MRSAISQVCRGEFKEKRLPVWRADDKVLAFNFLVRRPIVSGICDADGRQIPRNSWSIHCWRIRCCIEVTKTQRHPIEYAVWMNINPFSQFIVGGPELDGWRSAGRHFQRLFQGPTIGSQCGVDSQRQRTGIGLSNNGLTDGRRQIGRHFGGKWKAQAANSHIIWTILKTIFYITVGHITVGDRRWYLIRHILPGHAESICQRKRRHLWCRGWCAHVRLGIVWYTNSRGVQRSGAASSRCLHRRVPGIQWHHTQQHHITSLPGWIRCVSIVPPVIPLDQSDWHSNSNACRLVCFIHHRSTWFVHNWCWTDIASHS